MTKRKTKPVEVSEIEAPRLICPECGCPHSIDGKCVSCGTPWPAED